MEPGSGVAIPRICLGISITLTLEQVAYIAISTPCTVVWHGVVTLDTYVEVLSLETEVANSKVHFWRELPQCFSV